jgi:hypothetical protein
MPDIHNRIELATMTRYHDDEVSMIDEEEEGGDNDVEAGLLSGQKIQFEGLRRPLCVYNHPVVEMLTSCTEYGAYVLPQLYTQQNSSY